jgi:hypothetical protein
MRWHAIVWINGYPFGGIEWDTEEEAERDRERLLSAFATIGIDAANPTPEVNP